MSLPIDNHTPAGVLAITNNYYEFIPESQADLNNPAFLAAHELKCGERYLVIITTPGGLYRYDINDVLDHVPCSRCFLQ